MFPTFRERTLSESRSLEAYLLEICGLDPERDQEQVLALRRDYLHKYKHPSAEGVALAQSRKSAGANSRAVVSKGNESKRVRAERVLSDIREKFWERGGPELEARLTSLEIGDLPDLARYRDRLLLVAAQHDSIALIGRDINVNEELFEALCSILVEPERTAAGLRSSYIKSSIGHQRSASDKKSVSALSKKYPAVYELEESWFKRIRSAKKDHKDSRKLRGSLGCFGLYAVFVLIKWLIRYFNDQG